MSATLTGRTRHRSQHRWGGRQELVLQVEETGVEIEYIAGWVDHVNFTRWRDARTTDLSCEVVARERDAA